MMTTTSKSDEQARGLLPQMIARVVAGAVVIGAVLFLPAGTWRFWPAWIYLVAMFGSMFLMSAYLYRRDPALLRRRMQMRETQSTQKWVMATMGVAFYGGLLLPGFDHRFGWSNMPMSVVLVANALVVAGFMLFFWVLRTNSYAARTVEVEAEQKIVTTGPYAYVRHPMYSAVSLLILLTPVALGSWWALLPMSLVVPLLAARIQNEEKVLGEELGGYSEYCQSVRWRLIPGLW